MKMKNATFWDVTPPGSRKNRRFGGTYRFHHQVDINRREMQFLRSVLRLIVTANVIPSSPFLKFLRNVVSSSATRRNIAEDDILHSHRSEKTQI
jgi:hypothetical protein